MNLGMNIFELSQKGRQLYETKALLRENKELLHFIFLNLNLEKKNLSQPSTMVFKW